MSNMGWKWPCPAMGIDLLRVAVGDRYVVERMRQDGYNFGGEHRAT
jgi:phosphoglucosamine mutase